MRLYKNFRTAGLLRVQGPAPARSAAGAEAGSQDGLGIIETAGATFTRGPGSRTMLRQWNSWSAAHIYSERLQIYPSPEHVAEALPSHRSRVQGVHTVLPRPGQRCDCVVLPAGCGGQ